ncbi:MAG: GNAT family N-acetyltransferase, partial [Bacteroidota bacterium]
VNNSIVGFSIIDVKEKNIWALFVHPDHEGKGIGKELQQLMLDWYFNRHDEKLWLGTAPGTRAENFYRRSGWKQAGLHGKGEIKFELSLSNWKETKKKNV